MKEEQHIPDLRFNEFKANWTIKRIGEFANVVAGGTPSTLKSEYWGGEIKWMKSGELNYKLVYDVENRITELGLQKSSTRLIPPFSVLIGLAGQGKTRGTVAMNMIEVCTNQSIAAIINEETFHPFFLYHNLDSRYDEIRRMSTGDGGRGGLNLKIIKSIKIALPSLPEQQKIADFLSAVDQKIQALEKKKSLLEQYKKGVMQKIFKQEIRFKRDDGSDYPEWEETTMKNISKINQGLQIAIANRFTENGENRHFYITNEFLKEGSSKRYYIENPSESVKCIEEDILMTRTGNTGQVVSGVKGAFHNNFFKIDYDKDKVTRRYLFYFLKLYPTQCLILRLAGTSTIPDLNHGDFYRIPIRIPAIAEQVKISNFIYSLDQKITSINYKLDNIQHWKKGLLQQMFV